METIYDALHSVQKSLIVTKNQFNNFGKYHYRSCEDILEAIKKILPVSSYVTLQDEIVVEGDRHYIKATATFIYKADKVSVTAFAREPLSKKGMDDSQITGATSSYARKYALNGLFLIDDNKDADTMDGKTAMSPLLQQFLQLVDKYNISSQTLDKWFDWAKVKVASELNDDQLGKLIMKMKEINNV